MVSGSRGLRLVGCAGLLLGLWACSSEDSAATGRGAGGPGGGDGDAFDNGLGGGSGGVNGSGTGGALGGGGSGNNLTFDDSCGGDDYVAQGKKLEIFVLFDNSGSMIPIWPAAVTEMKTFVGDAASGGISVAMKYFGDQCTPAFYETPDVMMGELPTNAAAIGTSLDATFPISQTATRPALEGAVNYVKQRLSNPDGNARVVILLVTDGDPDPGDCPDNTLQTTTAVAEAAFTQAPSVPTYVLATVPNLSLDTIAAAGGTTAPIAADLNTPGALSVAMNEVRNQELAALPCEYKMPDSYYTDVNDPNLVNLTHNGTPVGRVESLAVCAAPGGWYYDDPTQPTQILTCPATCDQLKSGGMIQVKLGCATVAVE